MLLNNKELEKIIKEIKDYSGDAELEDTDDDFWERAARIDLDHADFGDQVIIKWNVEGHQYTDQGYLTTIPYVYEEDYPEFSGVIHVPHPENPGGMGDVPGEWITVYSAINNKMIEWIKPLSDCKQNNGEWE